MARVRLFWDSRRSRLRRIFSEGYSDASAAARLPTQRICTQQHPVSASLIPSLTSDRAPLQASQPHLPRHRRRLPPLTAAAGTAGQPSPSLPSFSASRPRPVRARPDAEAVAHLVAVGVRLVRALNLDADVLGLLGGQGGQLGAELREVEAGNLLVQDLHSTSTAVSAGSFSRQVGDSGACACAVCARAERSVQGTPG